MLPMMIGLSAGVNGLVGAGNMYFQHQNLDYQRSLQNKLFAREDTSIQRRVADLKAAGLSPVLASGQGAGTGPVVSTQPMSIPSDIAGLQNALQYMQMENMQKQLDATDADISKTKAETNYIDQQASNARSMQKSIILDNLQKEREKELLEGTGLPSKTSPFFQTVKDAAAYWDNLKKQWNRTDQKQPKGASGGR